MQTLLEKYLEILYFKCAEVTKRNSQPGCVNIYRLNWTERVEIMNASGYQNKLYITHLMENEILADWRKDGKTYNESLDTADLKPEAAVEDKVDIILTQKRIWLKI